MLPIIQIHGSPHEQGLSQGQQLSERIGSNLETYFRRFRDEGGLQRAEVLERVAPYWKIVETKKPHYASGVQGIAEGAGLPLLDIAALNLRYEILYHQFTAMAMPDGCTLFTLSPERTANGHLYIGQSWDWIPEVEGAVLHIQNPDGLEQLTFTEAGIFGGKIGMNSAGLGLVINGLTSTSDDWTRQTSPFHVRCWEILRAHELEQAVRVVTDEERACSTHFLIAQQPEGVAGLEAAPGACNRLGPVDGIYAHANHFVDPAGMGIEEPPSPYRKWSIHRQARAEQVFQMPEHKLETDEILESMRDHVGHPNSICRHPDPGRGGSHTYHTVTAALMDLNTGDMWISDGPPCQNPFQHLSLEQRPS